MGNRTSNRCRRSQTPPVSKARRIGLSAGTQRYDVGTAPQRGRSMHASAIASGYSATQENICRRNQGVEQPAQHPADRHPNVELRQMGGRRTRPGQLPVAHHRGDKERGEVQQQDQPHLFVVGGVEAGRQPGHQERLEPNHGPVQPSHPAGEHQHEGEEVEGQRNDPEQRHRGQIGGEEGGYPQQQAGRGKGERQPT